MKKYLISLCVLAITGCATAPYQAVSTTVIAGETAVQEYDAWVKTQPVQNTAQNDQVAAAYNKYQNAMLLVCDAGAIYQAAYSTNSAASTAVLVEATTTANQALVDLDNLITSFGVKLQ